MRTRECGKKRKREVREGDWRLKENECERCMCQVFLRLMVAAGIGDVCKDNYLKKKPEQCSPSYSYSIERCLHKTLIVVQRVPKKN